MKNFRSPSSEFGSSWSVIRSTEQQPQLHGERCVRCKRGDCPNVVLPRPIGDVVALGEKLFKI